MLFCFHGILESFTVIGFVIKSIYRVYLLLLNSRVSISIFKHSFYDIVVNAK